jgi:hypothetical protein
MTSRMARKCSDASRATYAGPPLDRPINEAEYRRVFAALVQYGADGILVNDEIEDITNHKLIAELARPCGGRAT